MIDEPDKISARKSLKRILHKLGIRSARSPLILRWKDIVIQKPGWYTNTVVKYSE